MIAPSIARSTNSYIIPKRRKKWTAVEENELFQQMDAMEKDFYILIFSYLPLASILFQNLCERLILTKETPDNKALIDRISTCLSKYDDDSSLNRLEKKVLVRAFNEFSGELRLCGAPRDWVKEFVAPLVSDPNAFMSDDALLPKVGLTEEESFILWAQQVRSSHEKILQIKNEFLQDNLGLVGALAKKYRVASLGHALSIEDLIQEGCFGLVKAMERFDYKRGLKFSTYSSWWIRHAMQRSVADKNKTVRIPVHVLDKTRVIKQYRMNFFQQFGREPTLEEVVEKTGYLPKAVKEVLEYNGAIYSLDQKVGGEGGYDDDFLSFLTPPTENVRTPYDEIYSKQTRKMLEQAMTTLTERERAVVVGRFGFDGNRKVPTDETATLANIGKIYKLSRERIRQIEAIALDKMNKFLTELTSMNVV